MKNSQNITGKLKFVLILSTLQFLFFSNFISAQEDTSQHHQTMNDSTMMRQHMIQHRSSMVMPFDMNKVTHYFIKISDGGIIKIKAKDLGDTSQITLIKSHLKKEKELFSNADFSDPKTLHGINMPGIDILEKSKGKFKVEYGELSDGAQLTFTSSDTVVTDAIHKWFDAQLKDHGSNAKSYEE